LRFSWGMGPLRPGRGRIGHGRSKVIGKMAHARECKVLATLTPSDVVPKARPDGGPTFCPNAEGEFQSELALHNPAIRGFLQRCSMQAEDWEDIRRCSLSARRPSDRTSTAAVKFRYEVEQALSVCLGRASARDAGIICGVVAVGPLLFVNVGQLGWFAGRSKTSVNNHLAGYGYDPVERRQTRNDLVLYALPQLASHRALVAQFTVRYVTGCVPFCFCCPGHPTWACATPTRGSPHRR
jgi:hypothetical protein